MRKMIPISIFVFFLSSAMAQNNEKDFNQYMDSLVDIINTLPKSNIYGFNDKRWQKKYHATWSNWRKKLVIRDIRFDPASNLKCEDEYKAIIDIHDLHPDGVIIKFSKDSTTVSMAIFTARNTENIRNKIYLNGECHDRHYNDRFTLDFWDSKAVLADLQKIQRLLGLCITLKTNWTLEDRPDPNAIHPMVFPKNATVITFDQNSTPTFLNGAIEHSSLFMTSKSEAENREKVKEYVLKELKAKGIKYHGIIIGSIIISELGKVIDFVSANKNTIQFEIEVKKIILSMPDWTSGRAGNQNVKVSLTLII